jgi:hypothetical protein
MSVSLVAVGCGAGGASVPRTTASGHTATRKAQRQAISAHRRPATHRRPTGPRLLAGARGSSVTAFVPAVAVDGRTAAWAARTSGMVLLSFDQQLVTLELHSGTVDAGASGWRFGPSVAQAERASVIAAFNGGFKLDTGAGGFASYGRVAVPLRAGLGSIVTYTSGITNIGSWHREVPAGGQRFDSVRQNLALLVDHGHAAANVDCLLCWGATLGGVDDPARSALGVTADGRLIWAGGEHVTVSQLASTMLAARVVRAVELDINPEWVASYLYDHHDRSHRLSAVVPQVPGQPGVPGQFLTPYSRDFFTVTAR